MSNEYGRGCENGGRGSMTLIARHEGLGALMAND